jgi:hypothetical protein
VDTYIQQIGKGEWMLRNCTLESKPHSPAHFLALKEISENRNMGFFDFVNSFVGKVVSSDALEAVLVIRGTKTIGDILTDAVLKPTDYRGGKAHDGILRAARSVVEVYHNDLKRLLKDSGQKKLKLWLTGHSLGAGTASLVAIEFFECCKDWIEVEAAGFGTPALLSPELSYKYRDIVTTVVTDSDCVPRMSGTTMVNAWLRIESHDFGEDLLFDFDHLVVRIASKYCYSDRFHA